MSSAHNTSRDNRAAPDPAAGHPPAQDPSQDIRHRLDELRAMSILVAAAVAGDATPIGTMLSRNGFTRVETAGNDEEVLRALRSSLDFGAHPVDLLLLDVATTQFDGHALCRAIRRQPAWRDMPIILIRQRSAWREDMLPGSFAAGATDILFHPVQRAELIPRVISALLLKKERDMRRQHESELETELAERKVMEARLQYLVSHDDLTGLFNRRRLELAIEDTIASVRTSGHSASLLYVDLDQFKVINDLEGHAVGDRLLMSVANILRKHLGAHDILARISSDEYAVLIEDTTEAEAIARAETLRIAIDEYRFRTEDRNYHVCASIGVALVLPHEDINASEALARSSQACFEAKTHGRNLVHLFNKDDVETNILRHAADWVPRIREALTQNRFCMFFQPVIELPGGRVVGYEALIRMRDTDGALITPDRFIPVAERMGLIHDIDLWVVQYAIDVLARLPREQSGLTLNVNLSIHAFQDPALLSLVRDRLEHCGVAADRITFEITETAAVASYDQTRTMINRLRELGCRFALDDFGTGFSSFNYLKQFPVDYLKIDGSFIRNLLNDPVDQRLVRSMIEVGRTLDKVVVAEFVENAEILALLEEYGVNRAQGNFIGEPLPEIPPPG
ncbi:MAG: EAL domain-containing protein [Gammaproteobacteria bacterium]|nr:EAL domain-containing protein [Gammaproteobacteria bacterium]